MPDVPPKRPPRLQSPTERELDSDRGRRDRATPRGGEMIPEEFDDPITGNYEGEELQRMRRDKRSTGERLDRLEVKHDALVKDVTETRVIVGEMKGELKVLPELVSIVKDVAKQRAEQEHVTFTQKIDLATKREEAKIEIDTAKQIDVIKARADRRKLFIKISAAAAPVAVALWEGIKWLVGKL